MIKSCNKWFPWRFLLRHIASSYGFIDPINILAQLERLAQPSEVNQPIELLRAGVIFHARGLINTKVIQNNLDWVWPYWIQRQFDPDDESFIPRAFSITHVNLSHRNWTAVGIPGLSEYPLIDPRGLVTPRFDGWSLEFALQNDIGDWVFPSRLKYVDQQLDFRQGLAVMTEFKAESFSIKSLVDVKVHNDVPLCNIQLHFESRNGGVGLVSLRPYNPEGISFIDDVNCSDDGHVWQVNSKDTISFAPCPDAVAFSDYNSGDVYHNLHKRFEPCRAHCKVGLLTGAAIFNLDKSSQRSIHVKIPLSRSPTPAQKMHASAGLVWEHSLHGLACLSIPHKQFSLLYDAAIRSIILLSPSEIYAGPYTYKRFWFRDSAFILNALLGVGALDQARVCIDKFFAKQTSRGYFASQDGEWDSNGEALWSMARFIQFSNQEVPHEWIDPIKRAAKWIIRKRLSDKPISPHAGLFPAGFSAEHLGPNDYYYWDDFWGVAGLKSAALLLSRIDHKLSKYYLDQAQQFMAAIAASLERSITAALNISIPASPYRRLDSGAIGSIVAGYPLQLLPPDHAALNNTVIYLLERCFYKKGFFQDMSHSGINAYLTLHVAQNLLRMKSARFFEVVDGIATLATSTGQWPEAIHPRSGGGCMGDGQHGWAAAEWIMIIRNMFVREENQDLILCSGIPAEWLQDGAHLSFGPTPTAFGSISIEIRCTASQITVCWQPIWHGSAANIQVQLVGYPTWHNTDNRNEVAIAKR